MRAEAMARWICGPACSDSESAGAQPFGDLPRRDADSTTSLAPPIPAELKRGLLALLEAGERGAASLSKACAGLRSQLAALQCDASSTSGILGSPEVVVEAQNQLRSTVSSWEAKLRMILRGHFRRRAGIAAAGTGVGWPAAGPGPGPDRDSGYDTSLNSPERNAMVSAAAGYEQARFRSMRGALHRQADARGTVAAWHRLGLALHSWEDPELASVLDSLDIGSESFAATHPDAVRSGSESRDPIDLSGLFSDGMQLLQQESASESASESEIKNHASSESIGSPAPSLSLPLS